METYWICSNCGCSNLYPDTKECDVCGKLIDDIEVAKVEETLKSIEDRITEEKHREQEEKERRLKEEKEAARRVEKERKEKLRKEILEKKDEAKGKLLNIWWLNSEFLGIGISVVFTLAIVIKTLSMSFSSGVPAGWIFFIVLAVASVVVSGVCYCIYNEDLSLGFTNIIPAGLIGAFTVACTVSDQWMEIVVDTFNEGILAIVFAGVFSLLIFIILAIIATAIIVAVSHLLTAFLQTVLDDVKGGLAGLAISAVAALIYLGLFTPDSVSLVLG